MDYSGNKVQREPREKPAPRRRVFAAGACGNASQGMLPIVLNGTREIAIGAFPGNRTGYAKIVEAVCKATLTERGINKIPHDIAEALGVDHVARERARACLRPLGG